MLIREGNAADANIAAAAKNLHRIAAVLRERTPKPQGVMVQLSVEIVDMDRPSYVKERL